MTRSSMNSSIILVARCSRIINLENMIKGRSRSRLTYWAFADGDAGADGVTTVLRTERSRGRRWRRYAATPNLDGGRAMVKISSSCVRRFPKILFCLLPVQDPKGERFRRPALPFTGARWCSGWRRLQWRCSSEMRQNTSSDNIDFWWRLIGCLYRSAHDLTSWSDP